MRALMMISVGILLSACAEQSGVSRALSISLPDRYSMLAPVPRAAPEDLQWWGRFEDPVLTRLIEEGLAANLSIAEARARLNEAEALAHRARGSILTGSGQVSASANNPGSDSGRLSLDAEINLAGAGYRRTEAAIARLDAARNSTEDAQRIIIGEIAAAYLNLRYQQELYRTLQLDLASRRRTAEDVKKQVDAGVATRLDELRTQSLTAETRGDLPRVEAEVLRQRNRIATLLGVPAGALTVDLTYPGHQPLPRSGVDSGVPADLLRARPDIRQAERIYAAALSDLDAAHADRYPSLSLSGVLSAPLDGGASNSGLLGGLILPVFTQPALIAGEQAAVARVNQSYLQWRIAVLSAVEEVETAQSTLRGAMAARAAAQEVVAMNEESLALSLRLLNSQGNITVLDVVDRERALSNARVSLAGDTRDVAISYVDLRTALGQGHTLNPAPGG